MDRITAGDATALGNLVQLLSQVLHLIEMLLARLMFYSHT